MCELSVYMTDSDEIVMEGVVRLAASGDKVLLEDIIGRSQEVAGTIVEVNITAQKAFIAPA